MSASEAHIPVGECITLVNVVYLHVFYCLHDTPLNVKRFTPSISSTKTALKNGHLTNTTVGLAYIDQPDNLTIFRK